MPIPAEPGSPQPAPGAGRGAARPVRDGVLLGLAVGLSGLAFGAAAVSAGLSPWQACALSLLAYTGASQFALIGTIASGGSLLAGSVGAILLGGRNALYSLRLADLLGVRGLRRLAIAHGVTDESTAIALSQPDQAASRIAFRATFASLYLTWNLATLAGALSAGQIGSPQSFGLDVIGPAAFLALIWPRLRSSGTERAVAALGAAIALVTTPLLPPGAPIILAASAALAATLATGPGTSQPRSAEPGTGNSGGDRAGRPTLVSGIWIAVLATAAGCYAFKLAGLTIPARLLGNPRLRRFAELVPVALLAALIAVQSTVKGTEIVLDPARLAGLGAAVIALLLRAPFLVVIIVAAVTAALLRLLGVG